MVWIVERCLAKDPEERYGSTKDLARDLAMLRDHSSAISVSGVELPVRGDSGCRAPCSRPRRSSPWRASGVLFRRPRLRRESTAKRRHPGPSDSTFRRGFVTGARFAPDGQTIVYSAAWDGKPSEIFTTRLGSNESRSLGISPAGILAISSTGEMAISLGCQNRGDPCFGTLARAPLGGGAPREVLDNVGSADWSPDGKELAVIHVVDGRDRIEYPIGKVLFESDGLMSSVRVSPKGDLVAFLEHPSPDRQRGTVCVVDRSGIEGLTELDRRVRVLRTLWSPAGEKSWLRGEYLGMVSLTGRLRAAPWSGPGRRVAGRAAAGLGLV